MGARRIRREQRQLDQAESRLRNGFLKVKERQRRDKRVVDLIKNGQWPYTPVVQSWLSAQLDKPSRLITPDEVHKLIG